MRYSSLVVAALSLVLSACGNGKISSLSTGTTTGTVYPIIQSLSFKALANGVTPPSQTVHVHLEKPEPYLENENIQNANLPDWMNVSVTGGGYDYDVTFSITKTNYPVGNMSVAFVAKVLDTDGSTIFQQNFSIAYQLNGPSPERTLFSFDAPNGDTPEAGLVLGHDGNFYGTTAYGGDYGFGTIYKVTPAGVLTTLHAFNGTDGNQPVASLVQGIDGNFYGSTYLGGSTGHGTIFKISSTGVFATLYSFAATGDGETPQTALVQGNDGNFYGTTPSGNGLFGNIFKISPSGTFAVLHTFSLASDTNVAPVGGLILGIDGNFYGTTTSSCPPPSASGGQSCTGGGSIFKITPSGTLTTLYTFTNGVDGGMPNASLTQDADGTLYGTTPIGGNSSYNGTVFSLTSSGVFTTLYSFSGPDGAQPSALVLGTDGSLYGTTGAGGSNRFGTVFKISPAHQFSTLHSFSSKDGLEAVTNLILAPDGSLYGTTAGAGGVGGAYGTIFKINSAGAYTALFNFQIPHGYDPIGTLAADMNGNLFGVTFSGGDFGYGTIFNIDPMNQFSNVYSFTSNDSPSGSGFASDNGLILGADGNYYGVTWSGGNMGYGSIFVVTPAGVKTTLHSFTNADGANPNGALTQGIDGVLYGTTYNGGDGYGTVFSITTAGYFSTLHDFENTDGANPNGALVQAADGFLYGVTCLSDTGYGTVFKISTAGSFSNLVSMAPYGVNLTLGLTLGSDGNLYGTTPDSIFKMTLSGTLTILESTMGSSVPLLSASDGNLYGATSGAIYSQACYSGDSVACNGSIFEFSPTNNSVSTIYGFSGANGSYPRAALLQGIDGNFYGTTQTGGVPQLGLVFELSGPPLIPVHLSATSDQAGVELHWDASGGATSYNVYVSATSGGTAGSAPIQFGVATNSTIIQGLSKGRAFYFTVSAVNAIGQSLQSAQITAVP